MFTRLRQAFRVATGGGRVDDDARREMRAHLDMEIESRVARGETREAARRAALLEFGGVEQTVEAVRDVRGITFWDALVRDVRVGLRLLARQPSFTIVAVFVLSLGIGANAAVFSVVNTLLLKPRVGGGDGPLVGVYSRHTTEADSYRAFSFTEFETLRARRDLFASLTAHTFALGGISEGDATRRVFVNLASGSFFDTFGARLVMGRTFTADEDRPGADQAVTILSYGAWQRMGGRPDVLGTTIRLNAREFRVIGVAPKGFGGSIVLVTPEVWLPLGVYDSIANDFTREGMTTRLADPRHRSLVMVGRLQPGASIESVKPALAGLSAQVTGAVADGTPRHDVELAPLARLSVSTSPTDDSMLSGAMTALLSMAVIVLLVASFNLANMLLARAGTRRKEFAVRLALGGSRGRIVRQLLTEAFMLALLGGLGGLVISMWATRLLVAMLMPVLPVSLAFDATPDWRIVAAVAGYCMLTTVAFGLLPARSLARTSPAPWLRSQEPAPERRRGFATPNVLITLQLAMSLMLLTVAALFVRGSIEAARADPGFTLDRGVLLQIDPAMAGFDAIRSRALQLAALAAVRARPETVSASLASSMPFGDTRHGIDVQLPGAPVRRGDPGSDANLIAATLTSLSSGYFSTIERPLLAGRDFTAAEESSAGGARVAIIDELLARQLFAGENPIGRQLQYSGRGESPQPVLFEVIGVVPGMRESLFEPGPVPHVYFPIGQEFMTGVFLHVRTRATSADAEAALLPAYRQTLARVEPRLPIVSAETRPMFRQRSMELALLRIAASMFTAFGAVALVLAVVGVYGVKAYAVSRRTREIGIRVALGATPGRVIRDIARDGLTWVATGLVLGVLLSAGAGTLLRGLIYQARAADPALLAAAAALFTCAAGLAAWLPARRAARIAPVQALRE